MEYMMKTKACGFEFDIQDTVLRVFIPKDKESVTLTEILVLGSYVSHEGFLDHTNVYGFEIYDQSGKRLFHNQFTDTFFVQ